jgi:tetratricopeptide (TPR) repeat protein
MLLDAIVKIADWLARATTDNPPWLALLASTHERFGNLYVARGDLGAALASYRKSHSTFELLASAYPTHAMKQHDLAISLDKIGEIRSAQGDLRAALESYEASQIIRTRMVEAEPTNPVWQHALSCSHESIGDIQSTQGDLDAAMKSYRASLFAIQEAARAEPDNLEWQLDLSASHDRLGDMYRIQRNYNDALSRYRAAHAIRGRLARTDPSDVRWQYGLFVSYVKTGEVLRAQSDFDGALDSYRDAQATAKRLTEIERIMQVGSVHSVAFGSVGETFIGAIESEQNNLGAALGSFRACVAARDQLVAIDPDNTAWRRLLAETHRNMAVVLEAQGAFRAALDSYAASLAIAKHLCGNTGSWQCVIFTGRFACIASSKARIALRHHFYQPLWRTMSMRTIRPG